MNERIRIGVLGCGLFSKHFVQLFKAHPYVDKVSEIGRASCRERVFGGV